MIEKAGYSLVTPVLVANYVLFQEVSATDKTQVESGEQLLTVR